MTEESTETPKLNKREIIAAAILAGNATRETLMVSADVNAAGLASQFTYLRMEGNCPVPDKETGIFSFISKEDWEEQREAAKTNRSKPAGPKKSALERRTALEKREAKLKVDVQKKKEAFDKTENRENELKIVLASTTLELCQIDLKKVVSEHTKNEWADIIEEADEAASHDPEA